MGRYYYIRLHPFSLAEVVSGKRSRKINVSKELVFLKDNKNFPGLFASLFNYGGFPEPFIKKDPTILHRFHNERTERLVKEDIRDMEAIKNLSSLQILAEILPSKVGSLFLLNSLKEDLKVSYKTIALWADVLERFYYHFRIYPFAANTIRSLRKKPKLYLWDWSQVDDKASRLENLIASHLLKFVHFFCDVEGYKAELCFLRDEDKREVDFLVTINKTPWFAVEVKSKDVSMPKSLSYFSRKLKIPYNYQVVCDPGIDLRQENIRIISADKFLTGLV